MKITRVNWYERMNLWVRIGAINQPNVLAAHALFKVMDQIKPTEEEVQERNLRVTPDGQYTWDALPDLEWGSKTLNLENDIAAALAKGIDEHPMGVRVSDAAWMFRVLEDLKGEKASAATIEAEKVA